jgi:hypothetical protein
MEEVLNGYVTNPNPTPTLTSTLTLTLTKLIKKKLIKLRNVSLIDGNKWKPEHMKVKQNERRWNRVTWGRCSKPV